MTLELIDITFGRVGYPKIVEYTESDLPERWAIQWKRKGALNSKFYTKETNKTFNYNLNSQGYREKDWNDVDWNNSIVFLGCSHTFGVGVENSKTIPAQIQNILNIPCINLGIPGGSNFFSSINSANLINYNIKPRAVVFQRTYKSRWFKIENDQLDTITSSDSEIVNVFPNDQYSEFLDSNIGSIIKSQWKNICPVVEYKMEMFDDCGDFKYIARDGAHWNGLYFKKITQFLTEKLINTIPLEGDINELS
jgi:hypothetical protein